MSETMIANDLDYRKIHYSILDPTGNITALVESPVEAARRIPVAAAIMEKHPGVEQVGFVWFGMDAGVNISSPAGVNQREHGRIEDEFAEDAGAINDCVEDVRAKNDRTEDAGAEEKEPAKVELNMAGGEFCGNASMSAAALYLIRKGYKHCIQTSRAGQDQDRVRLRLKVSGAPESVLVCLHREDPAEDSCFQSGILMPPARSIEEESFRFREITGLLPLVRMEGISHIIIETDSPFYKLLHKRETAEDMIAVWCRRLQADGLGLIFLEKKEHTSEMRLTPLVYIPGGETVFWENSCASGTSAAGMYLAGKRGQRIRQIFKEPGGDLCVESDPDHGQTWLYGRVRLISHNAIRLSYDKNSQ